MPRKPQVSRKVLVTPVQALCLDLKTKETFYKNVCIAGHWKDHRKLTMKVKDVLETEVVKVVFIESKQEKIMPFTMPLQTFVLAADIAADIKE